MQDGSFYGTDEGLASFNKLMMMETFSLADNSKESDLRNDMSLYERYKTRLVRVDLARRNGSRDILRHSLRKALRAFWFFVRRDKHGIVCHSSFDTAAALESNLKRSYQNTTRLAEILTRFLVALLAGTFLILPLVVLSHQQNDQAHLVTVSMFILTFSLLISLLSKASNEQIMAASAGYAAVLVVFLSNKP